MTHGLCSLRKLDFQMPGLPSNPDPGKVVMLLDDPRASKMVVFPDPGIPSTATRSPNGAVNWKIKY